MLEQNYKINENKFNAEVNRYNTFLEDTQNSWTRLEENSLDFMNTTVVGKLEEQIDYVERQGAIIEQKKTIIDELESDYSKHIAELKIFD